MTNHFCGNQIRVIESRVQFLNLGVVDTIHETFRASILIKSRWKDTSRFTDYDPMVHWNPLLHIENAQTIPAMNWVENTTYMTRPLSDGTEITEIRKVEGDFWERFELADFPLGKLFKIYSFFTCKIRIAFCNYC